jgi:hypothetical protein
MTVKTSLGNITASEEALNLIAACLSEGEKKFKSIPYGEDAAKECRQMFDNIFGALNESGYYKGTSLDTL